MREPTNLFPIFLGQLGEYRLGGGTQALQLKSERTPVCIHVVIGLKKNPVSEYYTRTINTTLLVSKLKFKKGKRKCNCRNDIII
jgi:hypothetical protein